MNDRILFSTMSPEAKVFYHRLFNRVLLNAYAVKHGLFDTLFCQTEDPRVGIRWSEALPKIINAIHEKQMRGLGDDTPGV